MIQASTSDKIAKVWLWSSAMLIIITLLSILGYVFVMGAGSLSISFFLDMPRNNWREGGILPAIIGSLIAVAVALIFAAPVGVGASIYLTEFTREGKMTKVVRVAADSLNAIPSIVFGLFGLALFVFYLKDYTGGPSLLSAGLTLGFMILPTVIRTSEVAMKTIPFSEKMESYGLGASKLQTIKNIVLPGSLPGIVTGLILGLGRAIGETAPIIFMVALNPIIPESIFGSGNTLTTQLYWLAMEGISMDVAFGISLTLIIIILVLNYSARIMNKYFSRNLKR
ncbi:MAG: phosphate ABC transporter permease PstA [Candidatus Altiarchaeales archaeon]|nr:phosphate ABC transporter permease PstA [Candidatus Altiarchaeales archaeon]